MESQWTSKHFTSFVCCSLFCQERAVAKTVYGKIGENVYLHLRESHGRSFNDTQWRRQDMLIARTARSFNTFSRGFQLMEH
uniref:Uncharacterized protein n=1 Tax=Anguilla anguilla TaxID=7936 RepID=A0A0E9Q4U2_ANGAN